MTTVLAFQVKPLVISSNLGDNMKWYYRFVLIGINTTFGLNMLAYGLARKWGIFLICLLICVVINIILWYSIWCNNENAKISSKTNQRR